MKILNKLAKNFRKTDQTVEKVNHASPTPSLENKAQRINSIVGIWADRAEIINPASYIKKQRTSRF